MKKEDLEFFLSLMQVKDEIQKLHQALAIMHKALSVMPLLEYENVYKAIKNKGVELEAFTPEEVTMVDFHLKALSVARTISDDLKQLAMDLPR